MWIFTKLGFFSVTCPRLPNGLPNEYERQIRARRREHLEALRAKMYCLRGRKIIETKDADYRWRMIVSRQLWDRVAAGLFREIDYSNFKDTISCDPRYHDAALRVWSVMHAYQQERGGGHPDIAFDQRLESGYSSFDREIDEAPLQALDEIGADLPPLANA